MRILLKVNKKIHYKFVEFIYLLSENIIYFDTVVVIFLWYIKRLGFLPCGGASPHTTL